jgi:peptidyl-prolyl cis-trans isomerase SurA
MRVTRSIVFAALVLPLSPARAAQSGPVTVNGIAVKVNDTVITFREIEDEIDEDSRRLLQVRYGRQTDQLQQNLQKLKTDTVEGLVERQLILDEFKNAGYKLTESYIDEEIKRRIRNQFGDRVRMIKSLEHEGMTEATFRQRLREEFIVNAMEVKNVGWEKIIVSPHKIESYYTQNQEKFKMEDEVKLRMIFLQNKPDRDAEATRKLAGEILAKIKNGAAFAEMASVYSDGSQRSEGGLWPAVDRKTLREDLGQVAFSLKAGETSDVLARDDGCYLIHVDEVRPAHVKPLAEVRAEIEKTLEAEDRRRLRKDWIERLKAKSFISYFPTL